MNATRRYIDAIVQGATVELFHTYGVAIAPMEPAILRPGQRHHGEWACLIRFSSPGFDGSLILSVAPTTLAGLRPGTDGPNELRDWLKELTNQLMGRIKRRLSRLKVTLRVGLPTPISGPALDQQRTLKDTDFLYVFRTRTGEVVVSLSGRFDESVLVFSDIPDGPEEGEVILF